jgi:predicted site-specific integrase-resolvase
VYNQDAQVRAADAAKYLGISRQLINYWRASGKVEPVGRKGRNVLYRLRDLVEVEREMRHSPMSHRIPA